jgi:glycosyltransferase involved in cell wall biosynthesis
LKKILYLTYDGLTDPLGQSQIIPYLQGLTKHGYQFTILSFEKKERFIKNEDKIRQLLQPYKIQWRALSFSKRPPLLAKIFDAIRMKRNAYRLQRKLAFDMIHCRSYLAADVGLSMKKKFGVKFLFDMRGFWADEKVDNGQWNIKNIFFRAIYRYYKKKENFFLLHSDAIISLTEAAGNEIRKNPDYKNLPIDVIPCCADLKLFNYETVDTEKAEALRKQLGIAAGQKIISYLGSVGGWYMTKEMFSFYKRLLQMYPSFIMLFLTKDDPSKVFSEVSSAGIPSNKIIITYSERKDLPVYLSLCDCSIFFIRPTYSKIASSPTKHGELMGMGIPVICNDIGDTGNIIRKTNTGVIVDSFNDHEYDRVINSFPDLLSMGKKNIRQAAFEYFDLEKGITKYSDVYKRVFSS